MADDAFYRGRLAPTPSGYLHLGHARTFWVAQERARAAGGELILRVEDLDQERCKAQYVEALYEDLRWFGFGWDEGPDVGGFYGPYVQSERMHFYHHCWTVLNEAHAIYPSPHSRKDVEEALRAPHDKHGGEAVFPRELRPTSFERTSQPGDVNWRFRVPDGQKITFQDERLGEVSFTAGVDFGDFLVWRKDGFPSYDMAVVTDDFSMHITEVVRGEDLLLSTARQLLLYKALGYSAPRFYHCPLLCDEKGQRLAKRHDSLSLRQLSADGRHPEEIRAEWRETALNPHS